MQTAPQSYAFGPFRLDAARRTLEMSGSPVPLSARAFDMLQLLIESRDQVISREDIMARVWPGQTVEASNLTVQISSLRRALHDTGDNPQWIATVQGRGYRFIGQIAQPGADASADPSTDPGTEPAALAPPPPAPARRHLGWRSAAAIASCAVLVAALAIAFVRPKPTPAPRLSIVVMPLRDLSDGGGKQYLADAIADDLTTDLSHIPGSLVIARESADAYKGRAVPVGEVGRALNVRYLLEGSLRAADGQLRINAQLIDTRTGAHLWAERFDVASDRVLDAQTDIVRRIAGTLNIVLVDAEVQRAARERPNNQDALDHFYRGRSILDHGSTLEQLTAAQHQLEQAIAIEPDFVEALATLGWLLVLKEQGFEYPTQAADDAEAERVIGHALALSPHDPASLTARGRFLASSGRCAEATASFNAALVQDPGNVRALWGFALCAWRGGDPARAVPMLQSILRIDPQGPDLIRGFRLLGLAELFSGNAKQAVHDLLQSEALDGNAALVADNPTQSEITQLYLIAAYAIAGDLEEAKRRYALYQARLPRRTVWRMAALFTPAQTHVPAFAGIEDALVRAGMPRFADAAQDDGVASSTAPLQGGQFSATPRTVPGADTIDTARLQQLREAQPAPLILDFGIGMSVIPGALLLSDSAAADDQVALAAARGGIVVMDTGCAGIDGYNAALHLVSKGFRPIYWYRGGEEAWAAAGLPSEDRRGP
jgi:TolB-like protein/DNA-binding winged helix-turn-helix (wHTH) protein/Tfp pilus assembly protein PilF